MPAPTQGRSRAPQVPPPAGGPGEGARGRARPGARRGRASVCSRPTSARRLQARPWRRAGAPEARRALAARQEGGGPREALRPRAGGD
eukprot:3674913-Alexandrium_andersonii.AAC.1